MLAPPGCATLNTLSIFLQCEDVETLQFFRDCYRVTVWIADRHAGSALISLLPFDDNLGAYKMDISRACAEGDEVTADISYQGPEPMPVIPPAPMTITCSLDFAGTLPPEDLERIRTLLETFTDE